MGLCGVMFWLGGAEWTFFMGWQGWMEVYSWWAGVSGGILCVSEHFSWMGGGGLDIFDGWVGVGVGKFLNG